MVLSQGWNCGEAVANTMTDSELTEACEEVQNERDCEEQFEEWDGF